MKKTRRVAGLLLAWMEPKSRSLGAARLGMTVGRYAANGHLSFVSLYMTCLRATGSNFLISIFSGISFLFFDVV